MHACQSVLKTVFSFHSLICLHRTITVQFIKSVEFIHCVEPVAADITGICSAVEPVSHMMLSTAKSLKSNTQHKCTVLSTIWVRHSGRPTFRRSAILEVYYERTKWGIGVWARLD